MNCNFHTSLAWIKHRQKNAYFSSTMNENEIIEKRPVTSKWKRNNKAELSFNRTGRKGGDIKRLTNKRVVVLRVFNFKNT